jgi:dihydroorotase
MAPQYMFLGFIDTHVHLRDEDDAYKDTIPAGMSRAKSLGIVAVCDMANNNPRSIHKSNILYRNEIAEKNDCKKGYYQSIGGTKDPKQLMEAVEAIDQIKNLIRIKIFTTGPNSDPIVIKERADQYQFQKNLKDIGYKGVLVPHCEKEGLFRIGSFDPKLPATWNKQRPKEAEVTAITDMIEDAKKLDVGYMIHFPHVTCAESIDVIVKNSDYLRLAFEVTPQTLLYSTRDMIGPKDLDKKMNPPIRSLETVDMLWERLKEVAHEAVVPITIGSDNAPHSLKEKMEGVVHPDGRIEGFLSGFQGQKLYVPLVHELEKRGFEADVIEQMVRWNAKKIYPKIRE